MTKPKTKTKTKKTRKGTPAGHGFPDVAKALRELETLLHYASYPAALTRDIGDVTDAGETALATVRLALTEYTDLLDEGAS